MTRWAVVVGAVAGVFAVCLWVAQAASFGWLPSGEQDRWVVATAFATVVAGAVGAAGAWWAGQAASAQASPAASGAGRQVRQDAEASDDAGIEQIAGHRNARAGAARSRLGRVRQRARGSGRGRIRQVGGDDR